MRSYLVATALLVATHLARADGPLPDHAKHSIKTDIPLAVQARQAAERVIPYLERDGTAWINDRKCLTCHYVAFMVWSLRDAQQSGLAVDKTRLAEWTDWSLDHAVGQGVEGPAQMLLARDREDKSEKTLKQIDSLCDAIVKNQDTEGFWKPGGQLPAQKRPITETTQVSTMWCVLALGTLDQPNEKQTASRDKALEWLRKTSPDGKYAATSSEWYAARLLIERKFGNEQQVESLRDTILAAQQPDGGWGWLWADKSDAFGTGLSLYALSEVGVPNTHPAIERAWQFLIETQTGDGSWIVHGTKASTKDQPHPLTSFWGSAWASLGLSRSLPDVTGGSTCNAQALY
ncbi:MAG TPA: prenyltransferase/squalene oxidase repeat-containing protein [Pirellulales bacterium]|nr:prenyltransferase/squalene oxidase repeat-containing protein [Pirellulales bacterium]